MKKIKILLIGLVICLSFTYANSQEKGDIFIGGGVNIDLLGIPLRLIYSDEVDFSFPFFDPYPQISYFVKDNLSIGFESSLGITNYGENGFIPAIFLKYYWGQKLNKTFIQPIIGMSFREETKYICTVEGDQCDLYDGHTFYKSVKIKPYFKYEFRIGRSYYLSKTVRWDISLDFEIIVYNKRGNKSFQYISIGTGLFFKL